MSVLCADKIFNVSLNSWFLPNSAGLFPSVASKCHLRHRLAPAGHQSGEKERECVCVYVCVDVLDFFFSSHLPKNTLHAHVHTHMRMREFHTTAFFFFSHRLVKYIFIYFLVQITCSGDKSCLVTDLVRRKPIAVSLFFKMEKVLFVFFFWFFLLLLLFC